MKRRHSHLRTVLDIGPLTIDEIQTAKGVRAYSFTARTRKYVYDRQLNAIRLAVTKELERVAILQSRSEYDKRKRARKLEYYRAKAREYYWKNRDTINAKRRK